MKYNFTPDELFGRSLAEDGGFAPVKFISHNCSGVTRALFNRKRGWGTLGGYTLCRASASTYGQNGYNLASIVFHGGKNTWFFEWERGNSPRDMRFGTLEEAITTFESVTGLKAPVVTIEAIGQGVSRYSSEGVECLADNPWKLEVGARYEATNARGSTRSFTAIDVNSKIKVVFDGDDNTPYDPMSFLSEVEWMNLKKDGRLVHEFSDEVIAVDTETPRQRG